MIANRKHIELTEGGLVPAPEIPQEESVPFSPCDEGPAVETDIELVDVTAPPDDPDTLDLIASGVEFLSSAMAQQGERLDGLLAREDLLGRLHTRLAGYEQEDRLRSFIVPLTKRVAALYRRILEQQDQLRRSLRSVPRQLRPHTTKSWAYQALEGTRVELELILAEFEVEPFTGDSDRFDRATQEAVRRIATTNGAQVGLISQRIAPGFKLGERVLVPERVSVYVQN